MSRNLRQDLHLACKELKDRIATFITNHHEKLDGELWDAMEQETKILHYIKGLLVQEGNLTEQGLELVRMDIANSRTWFEEQLLSYNLDE
jgi:hypothetical protein